MVESSSTSALYRPLNKAEKQIRLVRLQPGDSILILELAVFSLDTALPFKALSYAWTELRPTKTVLLGGQEVKVRTNLYSCLQMMRDEEDFDWIFIDALCINQDDEAERESQVALMGLLFRQAEEVIAWVGTTDYSDQHTDQELLDMQHQAEPEMPYVNKILEPPVRHRRPDGEIDPQKMLWNLTRCFCTYRYWSRLWVVQEIVSARSLTVRCRVLRVEWQLLMRMINQSLRLGGVTFLPVAHYSHMAHLGFNKRIAKALTEAERERGTLGFMEALTLLDFKTRLPTDRGARLPLCELIMRVGDRDCSRRHDKLFGLFGLCISTFSPGYGLTMVELFAIGLAQSALEIIFRCTKCGERADRSDVVTEYVDTTFRWLLKGLDLDPRRPLIALITHEILVVQLQWDSHWPEGLNDRWYHHTGPQNKNPIMRFAIRKARNVYRKARWHTTMLQLRFHSRLGWPLSSPYDASDRQSVGDWKEWVAEMVQTTRYRLQSCLQDYVVAAQWPSVDPIGGRQ